MRQDWTIEEISLLIDNFTKQKEEIGKILLENGFDRTLEAIKTKKRDLRRRGEVESSTDAKIADDFEGKDPVGVVAPEYLGEDSDEEMVTGRVVTPGSGTGPGFFPSVAKKDLYKSYKDMMSELIEECRVGAVTPGSCSPVESDAESLVVMLSDHHVGKTITNCDGEEIFNVPIAVDRIRQIGDNILNVISHAQKGAPIDEIVVAMIGDMCEGSGDIYKTQAHALDDHVAGQLKAATKALWELIVKLSNIKGIKKVRVVTCRGNHGRISDFAHEDSNIDNLLYDNLQFAAELYGDSRITVTTKYSPYHEVDIRGHKVLLRHEAPITCDTPAARAKLGGWFSMHAPSKILLSGHFHHTQISTFEDKYVLRNASLCGPDSLSEKMGVFSKCEQTVFGMSAKRMITYIYPVTLE